MCEPARLFLIALACASGGLRCAEDKNGADARPDFPLRMTLWGQRFQSGPDEALSKLSLTRDGKVAAVACKDGKVRLFDTSNGKLLSTIAAGDGECHGVDFSSDGKSIFSCGEDGVVHQWTIGTGKEIRKFDGHQGLVSSVAASPDGTTIASTDSSGIRVFDAKTGAPLHHLTGHKVPEEIAEFGAALQIDAIEFSSDGKILLSEANDETARLWDVLNGREIRVLPNHDGSTAALALSPTGELGVSTRGGAASRTPARLRIWEAASGKMRKTLSGHTGDIECVAFAPDGRYVLSGSRDRTLRQWEVDSGIEIRRFNLSSPVLSVRYSPDGKSAYTISVSDGFAGWDLTRVPRDPVIAEIKDFETAWQKLGSLDFDTRASALNYYAAKDTAAESVADLERRLDDKETDNVPAKKLIEQLNDKNYSVRANASAELEQMGPRARAALTEALEHPSVEVRVRAGELLNAIGGLSDGRPVLAIEILGAIGTPAARNLLAALAARTAPYAAHAKAMLARGKE